MPTKAKKPTPAARVDLNDPAALFALLYRVAEVPSKARHTYWFDAQAPAGGFVPSDVSGKWCVFRPAKDIDAAWAVIEKATRRGELLRAKVATQLGAENFDGQHVICIYTNDYTDKDDVMRVREILRSLGFTENLSYKRDEDTRNRVYGPNEWFYQSE